MEAPKKWGMRVKSTKQKRREKRLCVRKTVPKNKMIYKSANENEREIYCIVTNLGSQ